MAAIDNSQQILHAAHGFAEKGRLPDVFEVGGRDKQNPQVHSHATLYAVPDKVLAPGATGRPVYLHN